jgi:D-3-phosphoglycerate dehydrogenase
MYKILTLNNIQVAGLERFPREHYEISSETSKPDAVLLRSYNLHDWVVPATLKAVGRAGAGTNNIPIEALSKQGIPVFNTPGANANAVKELVLLAMFMAARKVLPASNFINTLKTKISEGAEKDFDLEQVVEKEKKRFTGIELMGRTLGIVGLGAIGVRVANAAINLGMRVVGYDPNMTVRNAWQLRSEVVGAASVTELLSQSDFVSLHVPLLDETHSLIDSRRLIKAKNQQTILNFSRAQIVDEKAILEGLNSGKIANYISDFPSATLMAHPGVISLPHLGASTHEAEENCAIMVADQIRDFLEYGCIANSVNFPQMNLPPSDGYRMVIANANVPHMIERISSAIANENINIIDMLNRSRQDLACTLVDCDNEIPQSVVDSIKGITGVLSVRVITKRETIDESGEP